MTARRDALPIPTPPPRGTENPHERRFRAMEIAILTLIWELGITDVPRRRRAMVAATEMIQGFRRTLVALAPGRLGQ